MLEPLGDIVILEMVEDLEKKTGLIMPDSYEKEKDESTVFRVKAIGPGYWDSGVFVPSEVKTGDLVIVSSYGISKFKYKNEKVILSRGRDVAMIVREDV